MFKKLSCCSWIEYIFFIFIALYGLIIVCNANFGVVDDHVLLGTLLSNKPMPFFIAPEIGRFYPLDAREYSLLSTMTTSPAWFYLYNLLQFLILVAVLNKTLVILFGDKFKNLIFTVLILISLTPGFVTAWFRLFVPERSVLFFFVLFLYFFLEFHKCQKWIYAVASILFANIALYYKEPAFLLLGSFSFFHLLFSWEQLNYKQKVFNLMLLISSFIFLVVYITFVYLHIGEHLYGATSINSILVMAKNIINGCLGDPVIFFLLIPLLFWRLYVLLNGLSKINPLFDSLLFSSVVYVCVFFKLNMYAYHYLLPAYAFAVPAIFYYFIIDELYKKLAFFIFGIVAIVIITFSSLPTSLHLISHSKNVPNNFHNTLLFLDKYIREKSSDSGKVTIFLDGVNRGAGIEIYTSFIKNLEFSGLNPNQFNFKTAEDDDGIGGEAITNYKSHYTVWARPTASSIQSGDLLIITPYTKRYVGIKKSEINEMLNEYKIIFHTDSFMEIPNFGIKAILKLLAMQTDYSKHNNKVIVSENVFELPFDFYVLQKN